MNFSGENKQSSSVLSVSKLGKVIPGIVTSGFSAGAAVPMLCVSWKELYNKDSRGVARLLGLWLVFLDFLTSKQSPNDSPWTKYGIIHPLLSCLPVFLAPFQYVLQHTFPIKLSI